MPITYKIMEISNLFRKVKGLNIDVDQAVKVIFLSIVSFCILSYVVQVEKAASTMGPLYVPLIATFVFSSD